MMRLALAALLFAASLVPQQSQRSLSSEQVGNIATAMLDGDVCQQVVTDRALKALQTKNDRDPWTSGDNYDVDQAAFLQIKKTLLRVQSLSPGTAMNLWLPLPKHPETAQVIMRLPPSRSAYYKGEMTQPTPLPIAQVLQTGRQALVQDKQTQVILAPVWNSLGHVVGVLELVPSGRERND